MSYTVSDIAGMLKSRWLQQGREGAVDHLLTDSRKLVYPATTAFFAIKTASRDGHQFIPRLYQEGVRCFVVSAPLDTAPFPEASFLQVDNTLEALQLLAAAHRSSFRIPVIGITGSNGKTIVKEWLNQLLEPDRRIVRSPRSYNSQLGVPLSVWLMEPQHELAIFEAGISGKGEMDSLQQIIRPTLGILTNIGAAHSEGFGSLEEKLAEKWKLFRDAETIIYKRDHGLVDAFVRQQQAATAEAAAASQKCRYFSWSFESDATMQVTRHAESAGSTPCTIRYGNETFELRIPFTDAAGIENALTCTACLLHLELPPETIRQRVQQLHGVAMRLELKEGINHCSVINDSYSADLSSLVIALDFLSQQRQHPKRTVILSDIPETGLSASELYERVASLLQHHGVQQLVAIGPVISAYTQPFEQLGITVHAFPGTETFLQHLEEMGFHEETILVKGARRFAFEDITAVLEMQVHQTVLEIHLNAMLQNLKQYQQLLRPGTRLMAMVKAFSYGSGSFEIANLLQFHGVDYLAVAYTDEGVALRKGGINLPILVMNVAPPAFDALVAYNLEPVLYSLPLYKKFEAYIRQEGIPRYPVHLEIETGMNRLGFSVDDLGELTSLLQRGHFKVQSVFSHLAASEDPAQDGYSRQQVGKLEQATAILAEVLGYRFLVHIGNTAAIFRHPQWQFDMVRLGIGLYGVDTTPGAAASTAAAATTPAVPLQLQEVSTLKTTIAQIKELQAGETVGYGRRGVINRPSRIATVRIGYADGYPRVLGNGKGYMLVAGQPAPVIGSVCMDMTMLDVTGIEGVQEGDEVTVFGRGLPVAQLAEWAGTIPYEIMTGISQRVKRIYYQD